MQAFATNELESKAHPSIYTRLYEQTRENTIANQEEERTHTLPKHIKQLRRLEKRQQTLDSISDALNEVEQWKGIHQLRTQFKHN